MRFELFAGRFDGANDARYFGWTAYRGTARRIVASAASMVSLRVYAIHEASGVLGIRVIDLDRRVEHSAADSIAQGLAAFAQGAVGWKGSTAIGGIAWGAVIVDVDHYGSP